MKGTNKETRPEEESEEIENPRTSKLVGMKRFWSKNTPRQKSVTFRESLNSERPIETLQQQRMQRPSYRANTLASTNKRRTTFLSDEDGLNEGNHIDDVLRSLGFGSVQWLVFITAGFLLMSFVCETMGMSVMSTAVKCDLNMNYREVADLRMAAFIGVVTSSCLWGYLSDRFGRRKLLLISIHCSSICSIASMFSNNYYTFYVMRFFVGFFIAGPSFLAMVYTSEFVPPEKRARIVNYTYLFNGFAMLFVPSIALLITPQTWSFKMAENYYFRPWRLLGMIYTLPGILGSVLLWTLPESAYFYLSAGKLESALKVLNWISKTNRRGSLQQDIITEVSGVRKQSDEKNKWYHFFGFYQVFEGTSIALILCTFILVTGMFIITFGVGIWFADLCNRARRIGEGDYTSCERLSLSFHQNEKEVECNNTFESFTDSLILGTTYIVAYNILGILLLFLSRRMVFVLALASSGLCGIILAEIQKPVFVLIIFVWFVAVPGATFNLLGSAIIEYMPTRLR